ncbi:Nif3-like dinuclear metal center hexameric protein [Paenibacillus tepidiphilus]|uniref:Nif3-like dinuclear metal center hexameric protein n=1 Tax=Paenibacillus tepidiphilus TaxID=2608683 RepID=UPI00123A4436|nr:Nif3-like dinuclear metal center hexameric protein [Paenibacillus tepidiphilus]
MQVTISELLSGMRALAAGLPQTVDELLFGDPGARVLAVACAFSGSQHVIEQAAALGANLLIVHEGLFYSHQDNRGFLQDDPVYEQKLRLIEESGIAIYRCHDYWHRVQPDGIMTGLLRELSWEKYVEHQTDTAAVLSIPEMSLVDTAAYLKERLGISCVRAAGDASQPCQRVGVTVGYRGGAGLAVPLYTRERLDLLIAGEGPEWETPEYIKDAVQQGHAKSLLMLGHAESEVPGMRYLADSLREKFPDIPVYFIADKPVFRIY